MNQIFCRSLGSNPTNPYSWDAHVFLHSLDCEWIVLLEQIYICCLHPLLFKLKAKSSKINSMSFSPHRTWYFWRTNWIYIIWNMNQITFIESFCGMIDPRLLDLDWDMRPIYLHLDRVGSIKSDKLCPFLLAFAFLFFVTPNKWPFGMC